MPDTPMTITDAHEIIKQLMAHQTYCLSVEIWEWAPGDHSQGLRSEITYSIYSPLFPMRTIKANELDVLVDLVRTIMAKKTTLTQYILQKKGGTP